MSGGTVFGTTPDPKDPDPKLFRPGPELFSGLANPAAAYSPPVQEIVQSLHSLRMNINENIADLVESKKELYLSAHVARVASICRFIGDKINPQIGLYNKHTIIR